MNIKKSTEDKENSELFHKSIKIKSLVKEERE